MQRKALVHDANILIGAVLGQRVRRIFEVHAESISFFLPETAYTESRNTRPGGLADWQRLSLSTVRSGRKTPISSDVALQPGRPAVSTFFARSRFHVIWFSDRLAAAFNETSCISVAGLG